MVSFTQAEHRKPYSIATSKNFTFKALILAFIFKCDSISKSDHYNCRKYEMLNMGIVIHLAGFGSNNCLNSLAY